MHFSKKTLALFTLVAALAVPFPVRACNHGGTEFKTCCHAPSRAATLTSSTCCHGATTLATNQPNCGGQKCTCGRPADPRTPTSDRPTIEAPTLVAAHVPPIVALPTPTNLAAATLTVDPGGQSAIPHRILHCSWLI